MLLDREGSPERFCKGLASVLNKTQGNSDPESRVTVTIYRRKQFAELRFDFLKTRIVERQIVIHPRTSPEAGRGGKQRFEYRQGSSPRPYYVE